MAIKVETMRDFAFLANPKVNPSRDLAAFNVATVDHKNNKYVRKIYTYDGFDLRPLTEAGEEANYLWEDDENILFVSPQKERYVAQKEDKEQKAPVTHYYRIPVDGGEASYAFSIPLNVEKLLPLNESNRFLVLASYNIKYPDLWQKEESEREAIWEKHQAKSWHKQIVEIPFQANGVGYYYDQRSALFLYDAVTDELELIGNDYPNFVINNVELNAAKNKAVFAAYDYTGANEFKLPMYAKLYEADLDKLEIKCLYSTLDQQLGDVFYINTVNEKWQPLAKEVIIAISSEAKAYGINENNYFYYFDEQAAKFVKLSDHEIIYGNSVGSDCRLGGSLARDIFHGHLDLLETAGTAANVTRYYFVSDGQAGVKRVDSEIKTDISGSIDAVFSLNIPADLVKIANSDSCGCSVDCDCSADCACGANCDCTSEADCACDVACECGLDCACGDNCDCNAVCDCCEACDCGDNCECTAEAKCHEDCTCNSECACASSCACGCQSGNSCVCCEEVACDCDCCEACDCCSDTEICVCNGSETCGPNSPCCDPETGCCELGDNCCADEGDTCHSKTNCSTEAGCCDPETGCCELGDNCCADEGDTCHSKTNCSTEAGCCDPETGCCELGDNCCADDNDTCHSETNCSTEAGCCDPETGCCELGDNCCADEGDTCHSKTNCSTEAGCCDPETGCCELGDNCCADEGDTCHSKTNCSKEAGCCDPETGCCELGDNCCADDNDNCHSETNCSTEAGCCDPFSGCCELGDNCCAAEGDTCHSETNCSTEAGCCDPFSGCCELGDNCCENEGDRCHQQAETMFTIALEGQTLQEVYLVDTAKRMQRLTYFNDHDLTVCKPHPLSIKSKIAGDTVEGFVILPPDFEADKVSAYPLILDIHGGPKTVYGSVYYHEMQVWANLGFVVCFANPHGSDGKGNAFADIRGEYGKRDYVDLMDFLDAVLAKYPAVDKERLGVTGGSYGGFMTNWIITHTQRFKAACTQRSISNWLSFYGTSDIGFYFGTDQNKVNDFSNSSMEKLWDASPLKYIEAAQTPTLIIHSDEDYRCPLEQGMQLHTALVDKGVPSKLAIFHGENHELSRSGKPQAREQRLNLITHWFMKYLQPEQTELIAELAANCAD